MPRRSTSCSSDVVALCVIMLVAPVVSGCRKSKPEGELSGSVTYKGQPLAEAEIQLFSKETGVGATAAITGGTFAVVGKMPVGTYEVAVVPQMAAPDPEKPAPPVKSDIPKKAQDGKTSGLSVSLQQGKNEVQLTLPE